MHPHQTIGLHKETLRGFIWSQQNRLRTYMIWCILSVLAIIPELQRSALLIMVYINICLLLIVLNQGECVSQGSWDELAAQEGAFKDLLDAQS